MNKTGFVNIISIMFLCCFLSGMFLYDKNAEKEIAELKLSITLNYCSDAAVDEMLDVDNLSMDYEDFNKVKVNPQIALDTFVDLFCLNYGVSLSEENREHVMLNFMPVFVVAGYDGYYIASQEEVATNGEDDGSSYGLVFKPKMAYVYKPEGDYEYIYGLNLGTDTCLRLKKGYNQSDVTGDNSLQLVRTSNLPSEIANPDNTAKGKAEGKAKRVAKINKLLTDRIAYEVDKVNNQQSFWRNSFFLPANLTSYTSVNPVEGPSVMALVENVDLGSTHKVSAFSIAGSKITNVRMLAGYTTNRGGVEKHYYCYSDLLPSGEIANGNIKVENMYTDMESAAEAGYEYDAKYMQ